MHWLIPSSEHAFLDNPQVMLSFLRVTAEAGSIQDNRRIGSLPHLSNEVLDVQLTRLKLVGTRLYLYGVSLTHRRLLI